MRLLPTFLLSVLGILTYAQAGFRLSPDPGEVSQGGALLVNSLVSPGPGSFVAVGLSSLSADFSQERSYLTAFSCSSVGSASKRLSNGRFNVIRTVPGGGFITAGSLSPSPGNDEAYICRLNAALDTLSTVSFSHTASDKVYDIAVAQDASYVVGIVSFDMKVSVFRFSPTGVVLWKKEIPYGVFGAPISQTARLLLYGTNVYVGCNELNGSYDDVALHVLDITTGAETIHKTYGSADLHENLYSMKWQGGEIVMLTGIGDPSATRTGFMRLNSSLNPAMSIIIDGGQELVGARLLTNTDGYSFIGGSIKESGVQYSVVWQVWYDGQIGWRRKVNQYGSVVADMLFEGTKIVVPTGDGYVTGIMLNFIDVSTGFVSNACENHGSPSIIGTPYPSMTVTPFTPVTLADAVFLETRGSTLASYSGIAQPCAIPLPVEELYFRASPEGQKVLLEWATATEHANDHFTVERSAVGDAFEEVVRVDGAGDSQQMTEYSVYDENPLPGISYYRFRQTDIDGTVSYSEIVPVEFKPSELLVPYPNPANAGSEIRVNGFVTAYDELGRKVATGKDFIVLPSGKYFLRSEDGQRATVIVI